MNSSTRVSTYSIQVTSFSISDTISGSTTSYLILSSGNNLLQSLIARVDDTCEYTVKIPSSICSLSRNVDITIVAANRLGHGPPSEPTTIGMCIQSISTALEYVHKIIVHMLGACRRQPTSHKCLLEVFWINL